MLKYFVKQRKVLQTVVTGVKCYHEYYGYEVIRRFMAASMAHRSPGLMDQIRRRVTILRMFPYFNHIEILPVRPPRPISEVRKIFKDLPRVSIDRKIERERTHHINVMLLLSKKRTTRDFFRAYASYVQEKIATREAFKLMLQRNALRAQNLAFRLLVANAKKAIPEAATKTAVEQQVISDLVGWQKQFFIERRRQRKLGRRVPVS
jgi:hypothetical protein